MKRTPEAERMHFINLRDCRTKIAETLLELEGKFNYIMFFSMELHIELSYNVTISHQLLALQNMSEEQNSNFDIFLRDVITCINNEEELMRNIKETSEVDIPREVYVEKIINSSIIIVIMVFNMISYNKFYDF